MTAKFLHDSRILFHLRQPHKPPPPHLHPSPGIFSGKGEVRVLREKKHSKIRQDSHVMRDVAMHEEMIGPSAAQAKPDSLGTSLVCWLSPTPPPLQQKSDVWNFVTADLGKYG